MINFKDLEGLVFLHRGENPIYIYIYIYIYMRPLGF
jgi:hypothetical protein